ncbi:hypothetical protein NB2BOR_A03980 [Bordetella parapertussis]|nr:hypothetical protein NB2BOR_A03980 [Bordetella parapertussis]
MLECVLLQPLRYLARQEVVHDGAAGDVDQAIEQRDVDGLSFAAEVAVLQRAQDRRRGVDARDHIGDRDAGLERAAAGLGVRQAGDAHQSAHALEYVVVAGQVGVRAGLAESGDRAIHEPRIDLAQRLIVQAEARQRADLVVLDQHVRVLGELADDFLAFGAGDVQRHRLLASVGAEEVGGIGGFLAVRVLQERRPPAAQVVACAGALDLDDPGAHVGQDLRGPGSGQDAGEVHDLDVLKCLFHGGARRRCGRRAMGD